MAPQDKQHEPSDAWNAYFVAPLLTGIGIGAIFGSLFAMGKPAYAGLIIAGAGVAVTLSGFLMIRGLGKSDNNSEEA